MKTRRGQALIFVFFLLLLGGILASALYLMVQADLQASSWEGGGLSAFYVAQAGIEQAKIEARNGVITAPNWSSAQTLGDGRYYFYIENIGANQRLLRSIGQRLDNSGNVIAERRIEVRVQGIGAPPESQVSRSWREI